MQQGNFLFQAFIYLLAAVVSVPVAKRLGLGSVLGYLLAGVIMGPFILGFIGDEGQDIMHFAEFGVVMMLFLIGLELQPAKLWRLRIPILGLGGAQVGVTTLVFTPVGIALGLPWQASLAIGLALALSSTALVMQSLAEKNLTKTIGGRNAFSVLLFQDIAVIPILAILPLLAPSNVVESLPGNSFSWIESFPFWAKTLVVIGVFAGFFFIGKYLIRPLFHVIAKTRLTEIFTAAALLLIIGTALLMTKIGVSPALGAFMAGVMLAQSEYRHELETNILPFKGLLLGLFFISVGASLNLRLLTAEPILVFSLVGALIVLKFIILMVIGRIFKMKADSTLLFAFSLAQGGEFAFILLSFALQNNVIPSEVVEILIAVTVITMLLTPVFMLINERLIQPRFGTKEKEDEVDESGIEKNSVIIAGFGNMGSVVGRFLQANGVKATFLDIDADNVELLRKLGIKVYYGDASRRSLLQAAGAEEAELLIITLNDLDKTLAIVDTVHKYFPHLTILSRASGWESVYDIIDAGVHDVYRENFDSALHMGKDALIKLGFRAFQVSRASKRFAKHDKMALYEFAKTRHDHNSHLNKIRTHFEELEKLIQREQEDKHQHKNLDWDTLSRVTEQKQLARKK
ncbi:MAG: potassium transporter [Bacteroidia bacterium]|nr:monovalent cation:proton antiporter-2 (CPA2) family protein [Bacteroidales bacterium]MDD3011334.1 monovalent cation:proton antiporter-2 (CPA2) family protein [Bacteroidales bacterium]MDY0285301.1 monovalent cation:proton antiporter-2 (CPA2) family protein [Bacteroidales bacterium]NCD42123.1 potassium transporter [Bacteroidia bacterium]